MTEYEITNNNYATVATVSAKDAAAALRAFADLKACKMLFKVVKIKSQKNNCAEMCMEWANGEVTTYAAIPKFSELDSTVAAMTDAEILAELTA